MSTNHQIILKTLLEQRRKSADEMISENDYFHLFVTEQVLKNYELSYDELLEGIVDNGGDGGIDSIYTFVNTDLVQRDTELIDGKRNSVIDIFILQSKFTNGFSESAIEKCMSSAIDLFDLNKSIADLRSVYNNELLINIEVFRRQYLHLASKFPILNFHYFYASIGTEVHQNVERKVSQLKNIIITHFDKAIIDFEFLTASKLMELSRREQLRSKSILVTDNPISTQDGGYISIVPLINYYKFITDENGDLIKYFFDANIRDYQGNVEVNSAIKETLRIEKPIEDFWWLNNGITLTVSDASFSSKRIQLEDPQIVNGLQTSFEIYHFFKNNKIEDENRNVLLRIVKATEETSRLKVIKATNSQTSIPPASLRATDPIHRDIEDFLYPKGYFYDRRKNYYKNQGKPINKIVSIPHLAQIVMSLLYQKPDYARARPSTLIKNNNDYETIFNSKLSIELYYKSILLFEQIELALKLGKIQKLSRIQIGDIKFHVVMYITARIINKLKPTSEDISSMNLNLLNEEVMREAIENVFTIYDTMGGGNSIAKGKEFVNEVLEELKNNLMPTN